MKKFRYSNKFTIFLKILLYIPVISLVIMSLYLIFDYESALDFFPFIAIFSVIIFFFSIIVSFSEGQLMCRRKVMEECKEMVSNSNMLYKELNPYSNEKYNVLLSVNSFGYWRAPKYQFVVFIFKENSAKLLILDYKKQKKIIKEVILGRTQIKGIVIKKNKEGEVVDMKLLLPRSVVENVEGYKWTLLPLRFKRRSLQAFIHYFENNEDAFDNLVKVFNTKYN